jgi:hypothetical protein
MESESVKVQSTAMQARLLDILRDGYVWHREDLADRLADEVEHSAPALAGSVSEAIERLVEAKHAMRVGEDAVVVRWRGRRGAASDAPDGAGALLLAEDANGGRRARSGRVRGSLPRRGRGPAGSVGAHQCRPLAASSWRCSWRRSRPGPSSRSRRRVSGFYSSAERPGAVRRRAPELRTTRGAPAGLPVTGRPDQRLEHCCHSVASRAQLAGRTDHDVASAGAGAGCSPLLSAARFRIV